MINKKLYGAIALGICVLLIIPMVNVTNGKAQKINIEKEKLNSSSIVKTDAQSEYKVKGYSKDKVMEAKMFIERILYQLQEIISSDSSKKEAENPNTALETKAPEISMKTQVNLQNDADNNKKEEDISNYKELTEKIKEKDAIYFMLKLKSDFGSIEGALNEYLYSLQAGLDLNLYISNKKKYLKEKEDKGLSIDESKIITVSKIESKALEVVQNKNIKKINQDDKQMKQEEIKANINSNTKVDKPEAPEPDINNIKPENPSDQINKELNEIKDRSFGNQDKDSVDGGGKAK